MHRVHAIRRVQCDDAADNQQDAEIGGDHRRRRVSGKKSADADENQCDAEADRELCQANSMVKGGFSSRVYMLFKRA
jgi:hypothetical protein